MKDKTPAERLKDAVALTSSRTPRLYTAFFVCWCSLWTDETSRRNVKQQRDAHCDIPFLLHKKTPVLRQA